MDGGSQGGLSEGGSGRAQVAGSGQASPGGWVRARPSVKWLLGSRLFLFVCFMRVCLSPAGTQEPCRLSGFTPARCPCGKGRGRLDRPDLGARLLEDTGTAVNFLSLSFPSCWPGWGLEGFEDPLRSARLFTPFQNLSLSRGFTHRGNE